MIYQAALPRILRIGAGASAELASLLTMLGLSRPFIVTDRYLTDTGRLDAVLDGLNQAGLSARAFSDTVPEPTAASIEAALAALTQADHDCVVGFGGGSPIDSAKAIAILAVHGGQCRDYKAPHLQDAPGLPIIAIPTTAGTGSEATRFTIVTDETNDEKMLCAGLAYLPVAALVDYELTLTMPPRLTADTGIDALTHAIEAYVSRRANPFSDGFALSAMRAIAPNLRRVWSDPQDREARAAMMLGSTLAGIAFSNSSVALVHGMSRPIGAHFHVAHGLSNAMLLPAVTAWSAPAALIRYAQCARAMGVASVDEQDQSAVARLLDELSRLNLELEVPSPAAYGIDHERWTALLPIMAEQALASGSPGNNPIIPSADEIQAIYRQVWTA
ncbi:iron-containing alcohol dehydrogenase [Xanthomonas hyacinthi]|uniref:Alcohol dehydrogenase n=1 Tax=Xanthomonas hyacinthi TaxID=56455 RepID=A0A2S7F1R0_9XANT|nr:iron-containing alcohol dehydrogenase [Xanthomonas hyacinthi]KLD79009.1 alcohol dehydrogenase [Xanthomonas hyacinthi DSM 19077]PPU99377.1 alcohol dehydrogenase [Xanthomonas hyacinthi]QGY78370.1 iron-containing alcohol dehydrogenase [Xanthomonas hyacinthi]